MADDDNKPKMNRLGNPTPELKRFHPLSEGNDAGDIAVETPWQDKKPIADTKSQRIWAASAFVLIAITVLAATLIINKWNQQTAIPSHPPDLPKSLTTAESHANIEAHLRQFFTASSIDEKLPHVLDPDRIRPAMENYHSNQNPTAIQFTKLEEVHFILINNQPWCWAKFSDQNANQHLAALKNVGTDFLIDWESFVAYGEKSWSQFLAQRPQTITQMRVYLSHATYYNYKYKDANTYAAFKIQPRDGDPLIYGYVPRNSTLHTKLATLIQPGSRQPMNVHLRFEPDAGADNLVLIEALLHRQWTDPSLLQN